MGDDQKSREQLLDELKELRDRVDRLEHTGAKETLDTYQAHARQRYLEGVLAAAPDAIITLDPSHQVVEWNPGAERLFGYTRKEAIGRDLDHLIAAPRVLEEAVGFTRKALGRERVGPVTTVRYRKDGSPVDVILSGSPIVDGETLIGLVAIYTDITGRARMEEALRIQRDAAVAISTTNDLEETLNGLLEAMLSIEGIDCGGLYLVNRRSQGLDLIAHKGLSAHFVQSVSRFGPDAPQTRFTLVGEPIYARYNQAPFTTAEDYRREGLRALAVIPTRYKGRVIAVLGLASRTQDEISPGVRHVIETIATQIGGGIARIQAERALKRRHHELKMINQISQALNSILDLDLVLFTISDEVCRLLGITASSIWLQDPQTEELVCRQVTGPKSEIVQGWRLAPGTGLVGWVAHNGVSQVVPDVRVDPRHFEGIDRRTGLPLRSILSVPLLSRQGIIGVIQAVDTEVNRFDATDLMLVESLAATGAIAIENARLFATEQQRTIALAHTLEQQRELDRLRSEFIQNVSHELRTPLAIARGYAEMLAEGQLGELQPEQRPPVSVIVDRMRMLSKVLDDIAVIVDAETNEFRREPVDVAALVQSLWEDMETRAQEAGLALQAEVAPGLPSVWGDPSHLRRVLENLMDNAIKFTPADGRVDLQVTLQEDVLVLGVKDTGIGIPDGQQARIFERFYQVDGSTTRRYGGVGLGLALVKEVVEAHGGKVTVESVSSQGSTFTVTLPICDGQASGVE